MRASGKTAHGQPPGKSAFKHRTINGGEGHHVWPYFFDENALDIPGFNCEVNDTQTELHHKKAGISRPALQIRTMTCIDLYMKFIYKGIQQIGLRIQLLTGCCTFLSGSGIILDNARYLVYSL